MMKFTVLLAVLFALLEASWCAICRDTVCEYTFDIRHRRTMTLNNGVVNTFNLMLNGSDVVFEPDKQLRPLPTELNVNQVITADGVRRNVITVNGMFPGPTIEVVEGAEVVVHVTNHLLTQAITIHWHGIHQMSAPWMDGVAYITQCPIMPRQSFTYRFIATPAGTHWYHDHIVSQRSDGLMGMLIVHKAEAPQMPEFSLMVMDWFHHDSTTAELTNFYSPIGGAGDHMLPWQHRDVSHDTVELSSLEYVSGLINGKGRYDGNLAPLTVTVVQPGQMYKYRVVNSGSEFYYDISIDQHQLQVVALDGNEIQPLVVDSFIIAPGERIDIQVLTNQMPGNYWLRSRTLKHGVTPEAIPDPDGEEQIILAIVRYEGSLEEDPVSMSRVCTSDDQCVVFNCVFGGYPESANKHCLQLDEARSLLPQHQLDEKFGLQDEVYEEYVLNFGFAYGAGINSVQFAEPPLPFSDPNYWQGLKSCDTKECRSNENGCSCTQVLEIPFNKTIQMVFTNYLPLPPGEFQLISHHSIHMHGHSFAVLKMAFPEYNMTDGKVLSDNPDIHCDNIFCRTPRWSGAVPNLNMDQPPIRDTVNVPARGYTVLRFRSENPGPWFLHCHLESHAIGGMALVMMEAPERIPPPPDNFPTCTSFDWSQSEFNNYLNGPVSTANPSVSHMTTVSWNPMTDMPTTSLLEHQVTLPTKDFIGLIIGCVAFGAFLILIPFVLVMCQKRSHLSNSSNPKDSQIYTVH